jgi:hypothetical protein
MRTYVQILRCQCSAKNSGLSLLFDTTECVWSSLGVAAPRRSLALVQMVVAPIVSTVQSEYAAFVVLQRLASLVGAFVALAVLSH